MKTILQFLILLSDIFGLFTSLFSASLVDARVLPMDIRGFVLIMFIGFGALFGYVLFKISGAKL